jgi:hypothetical protein
MSNDDIAINSGGGESRRPEPLALTATGQYIDFALVNEEKAPAYVYGTNERAMTKDGKPKTKDVLTVLVVGGTGMIGRGGERRVVAAGDVACVHIEGQDRWDPDMDKTREKGAAKSWSGAKEDHGQIHVGDVVRWYYEGDLQGKGVQPRKIRLFRIRGHKPEEAAQTQRCRDLFRQGTEVAIPAATAPGPFDESF